MNEIEVIKRRRRIRKIQARTDTRPHAAGNIGVALLAPNARNQQKWHFTVIQNKEVLNKMASIMRENMLNSGIAFLVERAKDPLQSFLECAYSDFDYGG